ncbi:MAG: hypothetical protein KDK10_04940 [Maritimibacter sp.]|nr:hypothetical protein [Maritimibacter sp.]
MGHETYDYGRGNGSGKYFLGFFAIVLVGGILLAASGQSGARPEGLQIGPALATLVYLGLAGFTGWLAWGEVQGHHNAKRRRPIELMPGAIVAPRNPAGRRLVELSYAGITEMKVDRGSDAQWLYIKHRNGKLAISSEAMESDAAFQRMLTSLELRVTMARAKRKAAE